MALSDQSNFVCPVCGQRMMSANELCSGDFLDDDHPSNVRPIIGNPTVRGRPAFDEDGP